MIRNIYKCGLLVLFLIILSGCTVNYDLYVEEDNFTEIMEIYKDVEGLNIYDVVKNVKNEYGSLYNIDVYTDLADCGEYCVDKLPIGISTYKSYNKIKNYVNSRAISEYFGNVNFSINNDVYTINAVPNVALANLLMSNTYNRASVDTINVNIHIPYTVLEHNATSINNDVYTFTYNSNNYDKNIKISYTLKDSDINGNVINDLYGDNKYITNNKLDENSNGYKDMGIFMLIVIVVMILFGILYFVSKNIKNNNL